MSQNPYAIEDITVSEPQTIEQAPQGRHPGVLIDLFWCPDEITNFDGKEKPTKILGFVYQLFPEDGSTQQDGRPFIVAEKMSPSLFAGTATMKPARMRLRVERWRGKDLTPAEAQNFAISKMVGAPAWITVIHNGDFANVQDVEPYKDEAANWIKEKPQPVYEGYQRPAWMLKPRNFNKPQAQTSNQSTNNQPEVTDDEDDGMPF